MRAGTVALAAVLAVAGAPGAVAAQGGWDLEARGGQLRIGPGAPTSGSVALGVRYTAPDLLFSVGGGAPVTGSDAAWGEAGLWTRRGLDLGPVFVGVDLTGSGAVVRDRLSAERRRPGFLGVLPGGSATTAEWQTLTAGAVQALPVLGMGGESFRLEGRAGASYYVVSGGGESADRLVRLADVAALAAPSPAVAVESRLSAYTVPEGETQVHVGVTLQLTGARGRVWGSVGHWLADAAEGTPWLAGVQLAVSPRAALTASARHTPFDPLHLAPPQTAWSAGASVALGPRRAQPAPVPASYRDGQATLRLPAAEARGEPQVAGDFNDWRPAPMERQGDAWVITVELEPGVYNYAFVTADGDWYVPESVPGRRDDGMGGHVAVLVVQP